MNEMNKNPKYDGYKRVLASMVYKFLDKRTSGSGIKNKKMSDQQLAEELHKPLIKNFKKKESTLIFYRQYLGCWSC